MTEDERRIKLYTIYHVLYEIQMYQQTLLAIRFLKNDMEQKLVYFNILKNSLYESHMIHLRNMFLFFRKESRYDTDIVYTTIVNEWNPVFDTVQEYNKHKKILDKSVPHLTMQKTEEDYISRSNSVLFDFCFYSTTVGSEFIGFGEIIREFLNQLKTETSLKDAIKEEISDQSIKKLLSKVIIENDTLLELRDCFDIKLIDDRKIEVKVVKKRSVIWKDVE